MGKKSHRYKGFTLIELLIVITILATLLVVVFAAINPSSRLKQARDAKRTSDVDAVLTSIHEYIIDNSGNAPASLSTVEQQLGTATTGCAISTGGCSVTATSCLNLTTPLVKYLKSIPIDPSSTYNAGSTGYSAIQDSNGIVTIKACGTEGTTNIASSR
jgi:prepilin-type N-terminal cleavage/methylation domain-containing protein